MSFIIEFFDQIRLYEGIDVKNGTLILVHFWNWMRLYFDHFFSEGVSDQNLWTESLNETIVWVSKWLIIVLNMYYIRY